MRSERNQYLQELLVTATKRIYGLESLNHQSEKNLSAVNDHLEVGSAVFYFNHVSLIDAPALIAYLFDHLDNMRNLAVPTSRRHQDIRRKPHLDSLAIHMVRFANVEVLPVIQEKDKGSYNFDEQFRLSRNFINRSKEIFGKPGGVMLIAPEGTRSQSGRLQIAEGGFERFGKWGEVKYVPIALIPEGKFKRNIWIGKIGFNVGGPFDINHLFSNVSDLFPGKIPRAEMISHCLMSRLNGLLPPSMQGVYHPGLLQDTLAGRFEQRTQGNGRVAIYDKWEKEFFDIGEIVGSGRISNQ